MRIVSLVPSITEIVCALGLERQLVGISDACDYPPDVVARLPRLTAPVRDLRTLGPSEIDASVADAVRRGHPLNRLDEDGLIRAAPDVIFTQELCEVCALSDGVVRETADRMRSRPRVVSLRPHTVDEVLASILTVGNACGIAARAQELVTRLRRELTRIEASVPPAVRRPRVVYLEWTDPPYVAGHWVPDLIHRAGGHDVLGEMGSPSERVTVEQIVQAAPEVIVVGPCGYDIAKTERETSFLLKQPWWCGLPAAKYDRVFAVAANEVFSRPGPRLVEGLAILAHLFHGVDAPLADPHRWRRLRPPARTELLFDAEAGRPPH